MPASNVNIVLESPKTAKEFESKAGHKWAREIIVDYYTRTEDGWCLAQLVKILTIIAKENPTPGGLSRSYCLEVFYKTGENMTQEHWFVKIPKSLQTVAMDERELVMYNTIFPRLQLFLSETLYEEVQVDIPIPIIYFSSFLGDGIHDCLVTENLCASRYFQVDRDTTKLAYMRAAMISLANVHGITFSFMKSLGGKEALLKEFPTIKEQVLPKDKKIKKEVNTYVLPFLVYMAKIRPDISQQIQVLSKFYKFLYKVYADLQENDKLMRLKTLVHGDAKLDNFLFRKEGYGDEEKYSAMIIDWQGCGFDLVSNDLMWCLYGFIKNLPETGDMIHGFVEYSLVQYWDALKKVLKAFDVKCSDFGLPEVSEWATELIKEGFTLEFMKNAIIRPTLSLKNKPLLLDWFKKLTEGIDEPPPPEGEIFKSDNYANFIYLFFKIGTEVNVFAHLGKVLFTHMKEAMFSSVLDSEEDEEEDGKENKEQKEKEDKPKSSENTDENEASSDHVENNTNQIEEEANKEASETKLKTEMECLTESLSKCLESFKKVESLKAASENFGEVHKEMLDKCKEVMKEIYELNPEIFPELKQEEPKTITSMYGKVYPIKES